jgi:CDGSH-type Zn-finger protein
MDKPVRAGDSPERVEVKAGQSYFWCTCGKSAKQPFCDGSHKGTEFAPMKWTAEEDGPKFFCTCKETAKPPFCDGSHSKS